MVGFEALKMATEFDVNSTIEELQDKLQNALNELAQVKKERDDLLSKHEGSLDRNETIKVLNLVKAVKQKVTIYEEERIKEKQQLKVLFGSSIEQLIPYQLNNRAQGMNRYRLLKCDPRKMSIIHHPECQNQRILLPIHFRE